MAQRKLFMTPPTTGPSFGISSVREAYFTSDGRQSINKGNNSNNNMNRVKQVIDAIPSDIKDAAVAMAKDKTIDLIKGATQRGGGGGSGPVYEPGASKSSAGYSLSKAPDPFQVNLDSGVSPNTYSSDFMEAKENRCVPLHMSTAVVQIPTSLSSRLYNFYYKVISFEIQSKAQSNVSFNLNISTAFTDAKILTAVNALLYSLQAYYYFASIITYHSDPRNKNEGMIALRRSITPQMIEDLSMLARRLQDTPCPPMFLELIRYLSANYFSGDTQGSPLIKLCPGLPSATMIDGGLINACFDLLDTDDNNMIFSLLRRAVPQWVPGNLKDVPTTPIFDKNFLTIFANLPFARYDGTTNYKHPTVTADTDRIPYNSYSNTLDGVAFSLGGAWNSNLLDWVPSLIRPVYTEGSTIAGNTRKSYYAVGGVKQFYSAITYPFIFRSRQETVNFTEAGSTTSMHLFGTDMCEDVNTNTMTETSLKALEYLMSINSIVRPSSGGRRQSKR